MRQVADSRLYRVLASTHFISVRADVLVCGRVRYQFPGRMRREIKEVL